MPAPNRSFWAGKRVLVTGHTGFKGAWLTVWLRRLGAEVTGIGLPPATAPSLYLAGGLDRLCRTRLCDIRDSEALSITVEEAAPEIVFHLAAQALVRRSYRQPLETFATNVMGTANLLDALRRTQSARAAVLVTTDKVYRNREWVWPYREGDELGGHDPYSASKAASELVIACYRDAFFPIGGMALASARAGNVIGGGDWSEDRIVPDAIRAWQAGGRLEVRRPEATRPWQHVLEPLAGYLALAQTLCDRPEAAGSYNFGPEPAESASVRELVDLAQSAYGGGEVAFGNETNGPHEAATLALDISKARAVLGYRPRWDLRETVHRTVAWYRKHQEGAEARALCESDIADFEAVS